MCWGCSLFYINRNSLTISRNYTQQGYEEANKGHEYEEKENVEEENVEEQCDEEELYQQESDDEQEQYTRSESELVDDELDSDYSGHIWICTHRKKNLHIEPDLR